MNAINLLLLFIGVSTSATIAYGLGAQVGFHRGIQHANLALTALAQAVESTARVSASGLVKASSVLESIDNVRTAIHHEESL